MGPVTIFDKSALQALSMDEAVWIHAFFLANVVPLFYVETLADLEKEVAEGRTPEAVVASLAEKTPSAAFPNVYHRAPILGELAGDKIPMTSQALIGPGQEMKGRDGSVGVHIGVFPEAAALERWRTHDFLAIERAAAKGWRAELAEHDPTRLVGVLKNILPTDAAISDLEGLKAFIDSFCSSSEPEVIALALDVLDVPDDSKRFALIRWEAEGRPPFDRFAPYTTHVFKVDLLFYLGISRGFISGERASNKADMAYLYYLPFTNVFVSGDKLHRRTAPLFLRADQSYLHADELKQALLEFDEHYDGLAEELKQLGVLAFASLPPSDMDNAVTRLWDKHMHPDWREMAKTQEAALGKPRDEAAGRTTVAEITARIEEAQPVSDEEATLGGGSAPDYAFIQRHVSAKKGRWRMVSKEVEEDKHDH